MHRVGSLLGMSLSLKSSVKCVSFKAISHLVLSDCVPWGPEKSETPGYLGWGDPCPLNAQSG